MSLDLSNVNYSEIARQTGLSLSYVSLVFRGMRRPSMDAAVKICKALSEATGDLVTMETLHQALAPERLKQKKAVNQ